MKYKLIKDSDDKTIGIAMDKQGFPIVLSDDNSTEIPMDAIGLHGKVSTLVSESNQRRKDLAKVKKQIEGLPEEILNDPQKAIKAIEDVKGFSEDKKLELGRVNDAWKEKEAAWNTEKEELQSKVFNATTGTAFQNSKFILEKTNLLPAIAKSHYQHFYQKDGSAVDRSGNKIYSQTDPTKLADFEESIQILVKTDPLVKSILKAPNGGSGSNDGGSDSGNISKNSSTENIKAGLDELLK